jgi:ribosomal protein S18 acetylase RimI-like enzyme
MIAFEPLAIDEANAFLDESIREFVIERVPADHVDAGIEKMREELSQRLLTDGIRTNGHRFEAIVSNGETVGRVWFGPLQHDGSDLYICDISIATERRREGHARAAVERILDHARSSPFARVGLTVTQGNFDAIDLYESLGFVTTRSDDTEREMWVVVSPLLS